MTDISARQAQLMDGVKIQRKDKLLFFLLTQK
jgi:hypothetical protein